MVHISSTVRSLETEVARTKVSASVFAILTALSLAGISAPTAAGAAPEVITFQFRTAVDATSVGGDADAQLRVIYQFNPDLAPTQSEATFASYGPLEKLIVEIGGQCASFSGGGTEISVFDNAGTSTVEDSYDVRANLPATEGKQLFGHDFIFTRFLLGDSDATMFTSTALPTSPGFADEAEFQQTVIVLADPANPDSEKSLQAVDTSPFFLGTFDPPRKIGSILDQVRTLQVRDSLIKQLAAPLEDARALLTGTFTQRNLDKGEQKLQQFINLVNANRRTLGDATANSLVSAARGTIESLPACA